MEISFTSLQCNGFCTNFVINWFGMVVLSKFCYKRIIVISRGPHRMQGPGLFAPPPPNSASACNSWVTNGLIFPLRKNRSLNRVTCEPVSRVYSTRTPPPSTTTSGQTPNTTEVGGQPSPCCCTPPACPTAAGVGALTVPAGARQAAYDQPACN